MSAAQPVAASHRTVTAVQGSAFGYLLDVSIFGAPATRGPAPTVTLPAGGSASPVTAGAANVDAEVLPAQFFSAGSASVSTQGTPGPGGTVTSSTYITSVNASTQEALTASVMASTCTASEAGRSGSTTVNGGTLYVDSGDDINDDGDFTDPGEHAPVVVPVPVKPGINTPIDGHIHVNGVVETFRYVFNEHVQNADGSLTVYAAHQYIQGPTAVGHLYIGKSTCGVASLGKPVVADFNGNGTTDVSVYRPSTGQWGVASPPSATQWGQAGDIPASGDYDGNGTAEPAVFRPSNGTWYLGGPSPTFTVWGQAGDVPVPADYDGNGTTDVAVYRPSTGVWYVRTPTPAFIQWGAAEDIPVPGDYDGNGMDEVAIFRPSSGTWYLRSTNPTFIQWGAVGDIPVPADYDGNGTFDIAIFRPTNGFWYLRTTSPALIQWGQNGDVPVPGDYDGDRRADVAVFRPGNGAWYLRTTTPTYVQWGIPGDAPVPLPAAIHRRFF